jgi:putative ATP-dependent endonuclease of OLD family
MPRPPAIARLVSIFLYSCGAPDGGPTLYITRVFIRNYRCLRFADVELNPDLNVIVGDNESGKSTLLEAIHLALCGQLNGRPIQTELHPHLFNADVVKEYITALSEKKQVAPPEILIELYLESSDPKTLSSLSGSNNSAKQDCPGISLSIKLHEDHREDFASYVSDPSIIKTLPIEYYVAKWRCFGDNEIATSRRIPLKTSFIDASSIRNNLAANRYVQDVMKDSLNGSQRIDLALSYRMMKDAFLDKPKVKGVNDELAKRKGHITDKALSVSLDTTSRTSWETGIMPHLDDLPLTLVGKGEQSSVKIKLAIQSSADSHLILIEEAENHLSFSNLNSLISHIAARRGDRQLLITTHSSFVLNKLGIESVLLFHLGSSMTLHDLSSGTKDYFMRLPGHDTLRLILAQRSILVEGPSDELIVQAAYKKKHNKLPLEDRIDVISVRSLAFKRFLEIAVLLKKTVTVITDNDGRLDALKSKYSKYENVANVGIFYDTDEACTTLEPQLLKANDKASIENILDRTFWSARLDLYQLKS